MPLLADKVAIVTGAGHGVGRGEALELAAEGARVVVNDLGGSVSGDGADKRPAEEVAELIRSRGGEAVANYDDVADWKGAESVIQQAVDSFGRLDVLVNNAGMTRDQLLVRMKDDDWDQVLDTNLRGVFLMTRAVGRVMMRQRSGRIINISSTAGAMGNAGQVNYSAAKAGVIGLTKAAARELAHWNILVNAVAPGLIETDMTASLPAEAREALLGQVPLKRIGVARDVAEVVRFLAGDGAAYITGQTIHVNGGLYM